MSIAMDGSVAGLAAKIAGGRVLLSEVTDHAPRMPSSMRQNFAGILRAIDDAGSFDRRLLTLAYQSSPSIQRPNSFAVSNSLTAGTPRNKLSWFLA